MSNENDTARLDQPDTEPSVEVENQQYPRDLPADDETKTDIEPLDHSRRIGNKPKFHVIENKLYIQTEPVDDEGNTSIDELVLPLSIKTKVFRQLTDDLDETAAPLDQFTMLLGLLGNKTIVDKIDELDIFETLEIVTVFFEEFTRRQEVASLGILGAVDELDKYRDALTFDFRDRFGISVEEVGVSVSFGETLALIRGLDVETGSHYNAAKQGWEYPASVSDLVAVIHAEAYLNLHRKKGIPFISLPRPWTVTKPETVTKDELALALERLTRRSAFREVEADTLSPDAS